MKSECMIKSKEEFNGLIVHGYYYDNGYFVIRHAPKKRQKSRFGIAVGKKIETVAEKNYLKRQVKEIIRKNIHEFSAQSDFVIVVRRDARELNFAEKTEKLLEVARRVS